MSGREEPGPCWVDGALVDREAPALAATDSAFATGRGCYTTARVHAGRVRFAARHAARLVRDARRLGIGDLDAGLVREGLAATARAAFGRDDGGDGIVRIQASRDGDGRVHLAAVPRHPGPEPDAWSAGIAPFPHEGPMPWSGAKVSNHLLFAMAADWARSRELDEAILLDREGYAVEGARSNLLCVADDGVPTTPDLARGGVAGVGLEVLRERTEIRARHLSVADLRAAREIVAVNAIRGPRPVTRLDGRPIGDGAAGPVAHRLQTVFEQDAEEA